MPAPPIPECIFRRHHANKKRDGEQSDRSPDQRKDKFRNNNVTVDLGTYVREWNESRAEKPDLCYFWFDDNQSDECRNKRAKKIIDDIIHRRKPEFEDWYGPKTYTQCQNGIAHLMEWLIDELAGNKLMRPYTQGERCFPIRKLVSQKFEAKHKWFVQKEKRKSLSKVLQDGKGTKDIVQNLPGSAAEEPEAPLVTSTASAVLVVPDIADNSRSRDLCSVGNHDVVAPGAVTGSVSISQGSWVPVVTGTTLDEESESSTVDDIEAQIRHLQKRKKALICKNGNTKKAKKQLGPRRPRPGSGAS